MKRTTNKFSVYVERIANYTIRNETYQGKSYIVLPTVMMREGVHAGNHGPLLHTIEELGKYPESWNGIPVVVQHPVDGNGNNISANSPNVLPEYHVGMVFNTHVEGDKLKAEVWLEQEQLATHPEVLGYIEEGYPLEVSIGAFSDEEQITGIYNNKEYEGISRNHRPDHLALLPGGTGACSWNDGCGIRTNTKGEQKMSKNKFITDFELQLEGGESAVPMLEIIKTLAQKGFTTNEVGFRESGQIIQAKLDSMDDGSKSHYIEEVFNNYFIYAVRYRGPGGSSKLYRQNYAINEQDMKLSLNGDSVEVQKKVEFLNVNNKEENKMERTVNPKTPCCLAKVEQLIAHEGTKFTDDNKEWLLTLEEKHIDMLLPTETASTKTQTDGNFKKDAVQINAEQAVEAVESVLGDSEKFKQFMPKDMLAQYERGVIVEEKYRNALIAGIQANANKDVWEDDDLKNMNISMLEKIAKSYPNVNGANPIVDYSGVNIVNNQKEASEEHLLPLGVLEDSGKKE